MSFIPEKALRFGAQAINQNPISYGKTRVSGQGNLTYIMHCRAGRMPGQEELFTISSLSKPSMDSSLTSNQVIRAFERERISFNLKTKGNKYSKTNMDLFTHEEFNPHDDETLLLAIKASYAQIYGNFNAMESERPTDAERLLRNGDISIREFIRILAKSQFYRQHYYEKVTQLRSIELNFKHILGRPPINHSEVTFHIELIYNQGYESHIDYLIDSDEYNEVYGCHIVPYQRCWDSCCGIYTSTFNNNAALSRGFAISDNALHTKTIFPGETNGRSQLLKSLAKGISDKIKMPLYYP